MFSRILVPLDGSDLAARALTPAEELARKVEAPLHLVRVLDTSYLARLVGYPVYGAAIEMTALQQALEDERVEAEAYLKVAKQDLVDRGFEVTTELLNGSPTREIIAATRPGDLVIMSTHGRGGLSRWFLGSVAEDVVRRSPVPVMLIRANEAATTSAEASTLAAMSA